MSLPARVSCPDGVGAFDGLCDTSAGALANSDQRPPVAAIAGGVAAACIFCCAIAALVVILSRRQRRARKFSTLPVNDGDVHNVVETPVFAACVNSSGIEEPEVWVAPVRPETVIDVMEATPSPREGLPPPVVEFAIPPQQTRVEILTGVHEVSFASLDTPVLL